MIRFDRDNAAHRALAQNIMFSMGIVPMDHPWEGVQKLLAKLPPDEARKFKRKFRKLWRKEEKRQRLIDAKSPYRHSGKAVPRRGEPTSYDREWRRSLVYASIMRDQIEPILKNATKRGDEEKSVQPEDE